AWNQWPGKGLIGSAPATKVSMKKDSEFSPVVPLAADAVDAMQRAFDRAWAALCRCRKRLSAREACDVRVRIARVIFEEVRAGNLDPNLLSDLALSAVDGSTPQAALRQPYL